MLDELVQLKTELILTKEGYDDLVYEAGTLFKVMLKSNDHVVVKDDEGHTFILRDEDKEKVWSLL